MSGEDEKSRAEQKGAEKERKRKAGEREGKKKNYTTQFNKYI